jgi:hypothetical protein
MGAPLRPLKWRSFRAGGESYEVSMNEIIRVPTPDGKYAEFPASMSDEEISDVINQHFGPPKAELRQTSKPVSPPLTAQASAPAQAAPGPSLFDITDITTAIPKGIVKGVAGDILGTPGDIYDVLKIGSDKVRNWLLPESWIKAEDKVIGHIFPDVNVEIPDSNAIIEGLKNTGLPLDRPTTKTGQYVESGIRGTLGMVGGPLRWLKQMMTMGLVGGLAGEAAEDLTESPYARTGAEMAAILLTPRLGYSNAGKLLKENLEFNTRPELREADQLVKDSHKVKFPLLGPEALPTGPIQGLAADVLFSPSGGQLIAKQLKDRPEQVAKIKDRLLGHFSAPSVISTPDNVRTLMDSTKPGTHDVIRSLAALDPTAFRGFVADYIERAYEAAAQNIRGVPSLQSGWMFHDALVGTPQRKKNFEAMMEGLSPAAREDINTMLKVIGSSGKIAEIGETAGRLRASQVASRNEDLPNWLDTRRFPKKAKKSRAAHERLDELDSRQRKTYMDLAKAMGSDNPDAIVRMLELAGLNGIRLLNEKRAALLLTGVRADNGWHPPLAYEEESQ